MQIYLPRAQDVPIDYLDYDPKDKQTGSGIGNDSARYVEVGEPDSILTKLAAIRLHVNYGDHSNPDEPYSQCLDLNTKHEILAWYASAQKTTWYGLVWVSILSLTLC